MSFWYARRRYDVRAVAAHLREVRYVRLLNHFWHGVRYTDEELEASGWTRETLVIASVDSWIAMEGINA